MSHAKRLKELADRWDKDTPSGGGFVPHPPGTFQGVVDKAQLTEIKKGKAQGSPMVVFTIRCLSGTNEGKKTTATVRLDMPPDKKTNRPSGISIFKEMLSRLDISLPKKLTEPTLKKTLSEALDRVVEYNVVQNGQYTNTFINRLVHAGSQELGNDNDDEFEDEDYEDEEQEEEEQEEDEGEDEGEDEESEAEEDEEEEPEEEPEPPKRKRGRPKGSKNKPKKKQKEKPKEDDDDQDGGDEDWADEDW